MDRSRGAMMLQAQALEIRTFLDALFRYADPGTFLSLRAFDQRDRAKPPVLIEGIRFSGDLSPLVARATQAAGRAANSPEPAVFAPPVATFRDGRRARAIDVANGVALSVEIDETDPETARTKLAHLLGPPTIAVASGGEWANPATGELVPKLHLHWRLAEPTREPEEHGKLRDARWLAAVLVGGDRTAAPPAHPLRWPGSWNRKREPGRLAYISAGNDASEIHLDDAHDLLAEAVEAAGLRRQGIGPRVAGEPEAPVEEIAAALLSIPNPDSHWEDWNRVGMAAWRATGGSGAGLDAWAAWSAKSPKHDAGACAVRWEHFHASPPGRIGAGTIFFLAHAAGYRRGRREAAPPPLPAGADAETPPPGTETPKPEQAARAPQDAPRPAFWTAGDDWAEASIARRQWIAPGYLLRGAVTLAAGAGGAGKSSLVIGWACGLALGLPFGRLEPIGCSRVMLYNVEDDDAEQQRRLSAALRQFGARPADLGGRVIRCGPGGVGTLLEQDPQTGEFRATEVWAELERAVLDLRPDVVALDPLAELHTCEENDNTALRHVVAFFRAFAQRHNIAVVLIHHARKGGLAGDADMIRGAGSIVGAVRIAATVATMTEDEAKELGVLPRLRRSYFRLDGVKANYAAGRDAEWFELMPYTLDNGDEVAAALPWQPPAQAGGGEAPETIALLLAAIERGTPGGPYSPRLGIDEPRSVAPILATQGITDPEDQRDALRRLYARGVTVAEFTDGKSRVRRGLRGPSGLPRWTWNDRKNDAE